MLGLRCVCVCVKEMRRRITTELGHAICCGVECVTALEVINVNIIVYNAVAECVIVWGIAVSFIFRD